MLLTVTEEELRFLIPILSLPGNFEDKNTEIGDFPRGSEVENLPYSAGDMDYISGRELRSHVPRGNLHISTTESVCSGARKQQ